MAEVTIDTPKGPYTFPSQEKADAYRAALGGATEAPITDKPRIASPDGSFSTERTIGIEADGKHYNIPTIVGGKQLDPDNAIAEWRAGRNKEVGVFNTREEADAAGARRSSSIGTQAQPPGDDISAKIASIDAARQVQTTKTGPSRTDYHANEAKKGGASFLGMPSDLIDLVRRKGPGVAAGALAGPLGPVLAEKFSQAPDILPPTEKFITGSQGYREAMGVDPEMKAPDEFTRYLGGVTQMAAAGGPFALTALPARALTLGIGSARMTAGQLPALAVGTGIAGVNSVLGGDVSESLGFERGPGELVGSMTGMTGAAATTAGQKLFQLGMNRVNPAKQRAAADALIAGDLKSIITRYPQGKENIDQSLNVQREFQNEGLNLNLSLPQRVDAPMLNQKERALQQQRPEIIDEIAARRIENDKVINQFVEARLPKGGTDVAEHVQRLQRQGAAAIDGALERVNSEIDAFTKVSTPAEGTATQAGAKLRDLYLKQKALLSAQRNKLYDDVYKAADAVTDPAFKQAVTKDVEALGARARQTLDSEYNAFQQDQIPSVFKKAAEYTERQATAAPKPTVIDPGKGRGKITLRGQAAPETPQEFTFAELHSLVKRANSDLAALQGSTAQHAPNSRRLINQFKDDIVARLNAYEGSPWADVGAKLKTANAFHQNEYVPRFKQGLGDDIGATYAGGEFRKPAAGIVNDLIAQPRNAKAAKDFRRIYEDSPEAWQALRDGYMDAFFSRGGALNAEQRVSQSSLKTFIRQHNDTLKELPEVKRDLEKLAVDNSALLERRGRITAQQKAHQDDEMVKFFQGREPNQVVGDAFKNEKAMRMLAGNAKGDPSLAQGFARSVADHILGQADPVKYFQANEDVVKAALAPLGGKHYDNVKTALSALEMNLRGTNPNVPGSVMSPDPLLSKFGSSTRALYAHFLNIERGRSGVAQEGSAFLGRWYDKMRRDHQADVLQGMFYNTDLAAVMAKIAKGQATPRDKLNFAGQLAAQGARMNATQADEE